MAFLLNKAVPEPLADCDFMEVDDNELPNLQCLKLPNNDQQRSPAKMPAQQFSLLHLKQEPLEFAPQAQESPLARRQQTTEPVCPDDFSQAAAAVDTASGGACAPNIAGFDLLPQSPISEFLSADEVASVLSTLNGMPLQNSSIDGYAPSVPEVHDRSALHLSLQMPVATRQRSSDTITLMSEYVAQAQTQHGLFHLGDDEHDDDIMQELMDNDNDLGTDHQCDHVSVPCGATVSEHPQYGRSADHILRLHMELAQDVPHAKKKPMLHEFLGYILFRQDSELSALHDSVYFCRKSGDRVCPQRPKSHFRVAKFQAVSEVWRLIKCNSSKDCTKNMKRAMRMSTTNDRNYFVNLTQRMHRMQIFKFGERSLDFFRRVFPDDHPNPKRTV